MLQHISFLLLTLLLYITDLQLACTYAASPSSSTATLRSAADAAYFKNDLPTAIERYTQLLTIEPSAELYYQRASTCLKQHLYDNAISDLTASIQQDTTYIRSYLQRAKLYKLLGQCPTALTDIQHVLSHKADHKSAQEEWTKVQRCIGLGEKVDGLIESKQWKSARDVLNEVLAIATDSEHLLLQRCRSHLALGDTDLVLLDTRKILQHNSKNLQALILRGDAYYQLNELETARSHYSQALKSDPEHSESKTRFRSLKVLMKHLTSGDTAATQNQHTDAVESYKSALAVDPTHKILVRQLNQKLAEQYIKLKQPTEALKCVNIALRDDTTDIHLLKLRAEAHILAEQYQQAINDYQQCLQAHNQEQSCQQGLHNAQALLKRSTQIDYYKVLEVKRTADDREIKKAYRKQSLKYHPDQLLGSSEEEKEKSLAKFHAIAEAYEVLTDSDLRRRYDAGEDVKAGPNQQQQQQQHHQHFHNPFGGFGGFPGGQQQQFHFRFGG